MNSKSRSAELVVVNQQLHEQNEERESLAADLIIANIELLFQNNEKEKRAAELVIANKELAYQNKEKEKRAAELIIANSELLFQNNEKEQRAAELAIANKELAYQNNEKEKRAAELLIANKELHFQNNEKEKRAAELVIANKELAYQNDEKEKRAAELIIANKELVFQNAEKVKRSEEHTKMINHLMLRNKDLEQFAYIISHNLRAPVANIIGASNALADIELSSEDIEILNKGIRLSVLKLDVVVEDLNQILQINGDIEQVKEIVNLAELLHDVQFSIKNLVNKYNIKIESDFSDISHFKTLKPYLYSIFYNLISNSVKYRNKKIKSVVGVKSRLLNDKIELIFTDNGIGIDLKKNGEEVFGLYKRFHDDIEGKGMGLYIVKTQVESLGGNITIKSKQNVGTEFTIGFQL